MGADGHIRIYDFELLESILGKDKIHTTPIIYVHSIFGKKVVTEYWGDNLYSQDCIVCGKEEGEHDDDGTLGKYQKSSYVEHQKLIRPAIIESDWEIWT